MEVEGSFVALKMTWSGKSSGEAHSFIIASSSFFCFWANNMLNWNTVRAMQKNNLMEMKKRGVFLRLSYFIYK